MDQEVLLELQRPLASLGLNERHAGRDLLLCLVCMIQEVWGAAEGHFHLSAGGIQMPCLLGNTKQAIFLPLSFFFLTFNTVGKTGI